MLLEARLAVRVDFTTVELRTLFLVADDFIGLVRFGEARLSRRIVLVLVRVVLFGQLSKGLLDVCLGGGFRDSEDAVGVTHEGFTKS